MPLGRKARGNAQATTYYDALQIFKLARLSRKDKFCDLGCGYGWVVRWASQRCKFAYGIEGYSKNLRIAKQNVKHIGNAYIIKGNFLKDRLPDANVLYCINMLDLDDFRRWNRIKRKNLRIVTYDLPPVPIKPIASKSLFYMTKFPFELARNSDEWYYSILGKRKGLWKDVVRKLRKGATVESYDVIHDLRLDLKEYFKN